MESINWGWVWSGIGALIVITLIGIILVSTGNGILLTAFLPLFVGLAGALILTGRDNL